MNGFHYDIGAGDRDINPDEEELRMDCVAHYIISNMPESFGAYEASLDRAMGVAYTEHNHVMSVSGPRPIKFLRANYNQTWLECSILDMMGQHEYDGDSGPLIEGSIDDRGKGVLICANRVVIDKDVPSTLIDSIKKGRRLGDHIETPIHDERIIESVTTSEDDDKVTIHLERAELIPWHAPDEQE